MTKEAPKDIAREWAEDFIKAGHRAAKNWACVDCGTTLHDFIKKGRFPCLLAKP